jgi:hypothetical protein
MSLKNEPRGMSLLVKNTLNTFEKRGGKEIVRMWDRQNLLQKTDTDANAILKKISDLRVVMTGFHKTAHQINMMIFFLSRGIIGCPSPVRDIVCVLTNFMEKFDKRLLKWDVSLAELEKNGQFFQRSHLYLLNAEEYMVQFENHSRLFFIGKHLINKDIDSLTISVAPFLMISTLVSNLEIVAEPTITSVLNDEFWVAISSIEKLLVLMIGDNFKLLQLSIPGDKDLPFYFDAESFKFDLKGRYRV